MKPVIAGAAIALLPLLAACGQGGPPEGAGHAVVGLPQNGGAPAAAAGAKPADGRVRLLTWDNLLPDDFRPDRLMQDYDAQNLSDDDPRAQELMQKLQAMWKEAPVVAALDGETVKLPGFVVPLEGDGRVVNEFLLVPYYGACVHTPPPPPNQMAFVTMQGGRSIKLALFDAVWMEGTLRIVNYDSPYGSVGYTIEGMSMRPYTGR